MKCQYIILFTAISVAVLSPIFFRGPALSKMHLLTIRRVDILFKAAVEFQRTHGRYPSSIEELIAKSHVDTGKIVDGWGRKIIYQPVLGCNGEFECRSLGPDGLIFTTDDIITNVNISHEARPSESPTAKPNP